MRCTFDLDLAEEEIARVEDAYNKAYGLGIRDVIEILLRQSDIIGACPFYPKVVDVTEKYDWWVSEIPDIDWRDAEAVARFMDEEE